MEPRDSDYYRERLLREKQSILRQIGNIDDDNYAGLSHTLKESTGELSSYDNHPADEGLNTYEREKDLGLKDNAQQLLKQIDDALKQLEDGEYGVCEYCGEEIGAKRLEVVPYATYCVDCKEQHELDSGHFEAEDRPVEEEAISAFEHGFNDDTDDVGFDGEDSWQKVAQYGTVNTPSDVNDAISQADSYINADEEQGSVDWGDRVTDQGFTVDNEEYGDENVLNWQPTIENEVIEDEIEEEIEE